MTKFLLFMSFLFPVLQAFTQNAKILGKVISDKNEPLVGVSVEIAEAGKSVLTDVEGRYTINVLEGKKYTIRYSYVGYISKVVETGEISANSPEIIDVVLDGNAGQLSAVTVTGRTTARRESTNSLLIVQKNNAAVSSVIAADFIRKTPDRNTSEVLKRVSAASVVDNKFVVVRGLSDRYNTALINNAQMPSSEPDKKVFTFDVIPSLLIDNIVVNKTATPDITGEFAGGIIQIQTKDIPTSNILSVGMSLGYNTQSTFRDFTSNQRNKYDWIGFDDGSRRIPASFPENRQQYAGKDNSSKAELTRLFNGTSYQQVKSNILPIQSYNLTWGNSTSFKNGGKLGTVVGLLYRNAKTLIPGAQRNRFDADRTNTDEEYLFRYSEDQNVFAVNWGGIANITYLKGRHKVSFKNLFNRNFEDKYVNRTGTNLNNNATIDFASSFLNQRSLYSGQLEGAHQLTNSGIKFNWNLNGSFNHKTQPDYRVVEYRRPISDPNSTPILNDDESRRFYSDLKDFAGGFNASLLFPFSLFGQNQSFKMGGASLLRIRNFEARNFQYNGSREALLKPISEVFLPENIGADKLFLNEITQNTDKYVGVSVVDGVYGMLDNKLTDKLRVIWGIRAEYFQQVLRTKDLSAETVIIESEKWSFLPSANFTYSLTDKSQLRLSFGKTLARPEFREIAPFAFFDYDAIYGVSGNPDLKTTDIYNLDIRYEYYPKAGEAISFGAFYKDFKNPIEFIMNPASNADRQNYEYRNAVKAVSYGAEIEVRKDIIQDLSFFGNFTYLFSEVTFNNLSAGGKEEVSSRPLQGQSPYLVNAGFQYNNKNTGISSSVLYNRIGPRLYLVGSPPPGAGFYDIYDKPRDLFDFQVSKKIIHENGELKLTVSDIFNQRIAQYDNLGDEESFNLSDGDRITNQYKPGTTFTIGFTYNILK